MNHPYSCPDGKVTVSAIVPENTGAEGLFSPDGGVDALLAALRSRGITLMVSGAGRLVCSAGELTADGRDAIAALKSGILARLVGGVARPTPEQLAATGEAAPKVPLPSTTEGGAP